ncbi:hypothetical protein BCV72DRAFT_230533 [Rhizopus microsporus var. microsporus]|uniref:Uncharacterized protein n=2 Tax=Rhizopus microsporus TaxID=58291 RepID=A0A2G4T490_RHIZD|nr:uncharacterized protein RHIMIDRAFT_273677 [Rhizopus microsporus ATCC 52813]ORE05100.1 hypothetical protein BCV72DRAFT_230533 [Rhizopus microsporus var. microsporus]PHZ15841.1 hypothetical protein RHIMIDRAFT_273677 [Rhizopus microsporus ATCC 52813]
MATSEYTKALAKISKIRINRTLKPTFSTIESTQHSADRMATHLEFIYSGDLFGGVQAYEITPPTLRSDEECPFDVNLIRDATNHLSAKKGPSGVDHLRIEMLKPTQYLLAPALFALFRLRWSWSYTPQNWRIAQVVHCSHFFLPLNPKESFSFSFLFVLISSGWSFHCAQQDVTLNKTRYFH